MEDKFLYFLLGLLSMTFISIIISAQQPTPESDIVCGKCGAYEWYFKLAVNDEEDK